MLKIHKNNDLMPKILGIDTSCDDTSIAIIEPQNDGSFAVLSNIISSQVEMHKEFGGVYPNLAQRQHQLNLVPVLKQALENAQLLQETKQKTDYSQDSELKKILAREPQLYSLLVEFLSTYQKPDIDNIAITQGPGLEPCLWVGINFAKALNYAWNIPLIAVNHIEAHILGNYLDTEKKINFPAIALVVSGGHTTLIHAKNIGQYQIVGETQDDAAGECFDKVARILNLGYPGGPIIEKISAENPIKKIDIKLPRPMLKTKNFDFSFSGLKTAVLYEYQKNFSKQENKQDYLNSLAKETQDAIIDVLVEKTIHAAKKFEAKTIVVGGGVSASNALRSQMIAAAASLPQVNVIFPPKVISTDNGAMIAAAGFLNKKKFLCYNDDIQADSSLPL